MDSTIPDQLIESLEKAHQELQAARQAQSDFIHWYISQTPLIPFEQYRDQYDPLYAATEAAYTQFAILAEQATQYLLSTIRNDIDLMTKTNAAFKQSLVNNERLMRQVDSLKIERQELLNTLLATIVVPATPRPRALMSPATLVKFGQRKKALIEIQRLLRNYL